MRTIVVHDLGLTDYREVLALQRRLQDERRDPGGEDILLLTEHRPVITLGRGHPEPSLRVPASRVAGLGIEIVPTERGGDITYHGPGQLVVYGIIDLREWGLGVIDYVAGLEEVAIRVAADVGVAATRRPDARGAWAGGRKLASIGVNVRRWVTMHGIAINVDPDLDHFALIDPCGMAGVEATSLAAESGRVQDLAAVCESLIAHFGGVFSCAVLEDEAVPSAAAT